MLRVNADYYAVTSGCVIAEHGGGIQRIVWRWNMSLSTVFVIRLYLTARWVQKMLLSLMSKCGEDDVTISPKTKVCTE